MTKRTVLTISTDDRCHLTARASIIASNSQALAGLRPTGVHNALAALVALLLAVNQPEMGWQVCRLGCSAACSCAPSRCRGGRKMIEQIAKMSISDDDEATRDVPKFTKVPTPIGPFCTFESESYGEAGLLGEGLDVGVAELTSFATDVARFNLEVEMGNTPGTEVSNKIADFMTEFASAISISLARSQLAKDFQEREIFKLIEAWSLRQGESIHTIPLITRWKADNLRALAYRLPEIPPPPGINLDEFTRKEEAGGMMSDLMSGLDSLGLAQKIDIAPFTGEEAPFESEVVRAEWEQLCRDHDKLIQAGKDYGTFDGPSKIQHIDEIEKVESRWDVFYARFAMLGALDPDYEEATSEMLKGMGMTTATFREVLSEAHDIMRREAYD